MKIKYFIIFMGLFINNGKTIEHASEMISNTSIDYINNQLEARLLINSMYSQLFTAIQNHNIDCQDLPNDSPLRNLFFDVSDNLSLSSDLNPESNNQIVLVLRLNQSNLCFYYKIQENSENLKLLCFELNDENTNIILDEKLYYKHCLNEVEIVNKTILSKAINVENKFLKINDLNSLNFINKKVNYLISVLNAKHLLYQQVCINNSNLIEYNVTTSSESFVIKMNIRKYYIYLEKYIENQMVPITKEDIKSIINISNTNSTDNSEEIESFKQLLIENFDLCQGSLMVNKKDIIDAIKSLLS
jgi:hypothetical protein